MHALHNNNESWKGLYFHYLLLWVLEPTPGQCPCIPLGKSVTIQSYLDAYNKVHIMCWAATCTCIIIIALCLRAQYTMLTNMDSFYYNTSKAHAPRASLSYKVIKWSCALICILIALHKHACNAIRPSCHKKDVRSGCRHFSHSSMGWLPS